jgi:hypothetical protein
VSVVPARSTRNTLLATASAGGVVASLLLLASRSLHLSDILSFIPGAFPTYAKVSAVIGVVGSVALVAAFGVSWAGFVQNARRDRVRLLAIAGCLFAAYGAAVFVSSLLSLINVPSQETWKLTAALVASVAAGAALLVAAVLLAVGVRSSHPGRLLGWGCLVLAGHYVLTTCVYGFSLAALYDFTAPDSRVLAYYIFNAAGYLIVACGAFKAAIAFGTGGSRRDHELGVAGVLFSVGFLLASVGLSSRRPPGRRSGSTRRTCSCLQWRPRSASGRSSRQSSWRVSTSLPCPIRRRRGRASASSRSPTCRRPLRPRPRCR